MNVTCTGCPAKYAVPDEKVRGKKVRITCKHCGTNIVVDGSALGTEPSAPTEPAVKTASGGPELASAAPAAAAETTFVVGFLDDRQEPHTLSQIVELYRTRQIDDEVLVWKDGMADWLSPFDVPEIATAMFRRGVARQSAHADASSAEDEQTLIARSPLEDAERAAAAAPIAPAPVLAAALGSAVAKPAAQATAPAAQAAAPVAASEPSAQKAVAARRSEPRAAVDLFGGVAAAGSEHDSSLDFGAAVAEEPAHKLTGARNESSVLFSLDALTKPEAKATQKQKREKDEEASAALFGESAPNSLMNVGGGGLAALAAPDFTKPVSATVEPLRASPESDAYDTTPPNKKKGGWVLLLGSLLGIAVVAGGAFVMMKKQALFGAPPAPASAEVKAAPSAAMPEPSTAPEPSASAAPSGSVSAASPQASASPSSSGTSPTAAASSTITTSKGVTEKKPDAPLAAATSPAAPATTAATTPAPAAEGAAFDKGAAVAALGAAAASAGSCKQADGPTGSGKVSVTFAPSGRATATSVAGELAGTEVGGCVARLFRSAKVPPFSGDPVTVSKSFTVQ